MPENQEFDSLFALSDAAVVIAEATGKVRYLNAAFERLTGYGPNDMVGQSLGQFGDMSDAQQADLSQKLRGGRSWRGEFPSTRKSGERIRISATISPFLMSRTDAALFIGINREVNDSSESVLGTADAVDSLTLQELKLLDLFTYGEETREIARLVGSDEATIRAIEKSVLMKLGARNRTEAVIASFERGLLSN